MWWKTTRDIVVETITIVKGLRVDFSDHVEKEDSDRDRLFDAINKAHENCPESPHILAQNGTLRDMRTENKETYEEVLRVKKSVNDIKSRKLGRNELFQEAVKVLVIVCMLLGAFYGYSRYVKSQKASDDNKIEIMLDKIMKAKGIN